MARVISNEKVTVEFDAKELAALVAFIGRTNMADRAALIASSYGQEKAKEYSVLVGKVYRDLADEVK